MNYTHLLNESALARLARACEKRGNRRHEPRAINMSEQSMPVKRVRGWPTYARHVSMRLDSTLSSSTGVSRQDDAAQIIAEHIARQLTSCRREREDLPRRSSLSSRLASRLSFLSWRSISWLIRFCSLASSLRQHAMLKSGMVADVEWLPAKRNACRQTGPRRKGRRRKTRRVEGLKPTSEV